MKSSARVGGRSSKRIQAVRLGLRDVVIETADDDVAHRQCREVDPVVRLHHAEGVLDPQAEGTPHALGNMATQGPEPARHGAPGLPVALLNTLARLEGHIPQSLQFLLRGVVGRLDRLCLGR
jgi:hypothetical protein